MSAGSLRKVRKLPPPRHGERQLNASNATCGARGLRLRTSAASPRLGRLLRGLAALRGLALAGGGSLLGGCLALGGAAPRAILEFRDEPAEIVHRAPDRLLAAAAPTAHRLREFAGGLLPYTGVPQPAVESLVALRHVPGLLGEN